MKSTEEREFRLRPRRPAKPKSAQPAMVWAHAYTAIMNAARESRRKPGGPAKPSKPYMQRCSVRVTYSNARTKGLWKAHGRYIARDSEVAAFSNDLESVNIPQRLAEWQAAGDERLWRFILSPEFGERLDLKQLTREFVSRMESDLGKSLEWVAIAHFNTEHPHIHLAIRGRDVRFERDYVRNGTRGIAEDLCTRQLGYRTQLDADYARNREVDRPYSTSLDRSISQAATTRDDGRLAFTVTPGTRNQILAVRANVLVRMGLAEQTASNSWAIRADFESVLRSMKRGRDRQKTLADHGAAISDPRLHFFTVDHRKFTNIEGRVLVHGEDESGVGAGRPYVMIEGTDAQVHHVPYNLDIQEARRRGMMRVNSFVRLRRLFVDGKPILEIDDLGDAEVLLKNRRHLREEARKLSHSGRSAEPDGWSGWLGKYQQAIHAEALAIEQETDRMRSQRPSLER